MNKHSKAFLDKKESLKQKEDELRDLLNKESDEAEHQIMNYLKVMAALAAGATIFYGINRLLSGKKSTRDHKRNTYYKEERPGRKSNRATLRNQLLSKLSEQMVSSLTSFVTGYLARLQEEKKKASESDGK